MLKRYLMSGMAVIVATASIAASQAPAPPQDRQPAPPSEAAKAQQQPATITLSGCLVREQDVPGRKPNAAERAGVLEDYILTSAAPAAPAGQAGASAPTGTSGSAASASQSAMYKIEGIPDERLKTLVGKKVEVTGRVDEGETRETRGTAGAAATPAPTPSDHMPEFEATNIRELPGSCTPAQAR